MNEHWKIIAIHGLIGGIVGYFILHPAAMLIDNYFRHNFFEWDMLYQIYSLKHVLMAVFFGVLGAAFGIMYGFHDKKIIEQADHIQSINELLQKQNQELEEMLRLREDLADMIIHDLRNPLTGIILDVELLQKYFELPGDINKYITRIKDQAQRLNTFANDLLMSAKIKSGKLMLNFSDIELTSMIQDVSESFHLIGDSKKIDFEIKLPEKQHVYLHADKNLLLRMIDNLISNAFKYSEPNSHVTLRVDCVTDLNGGSSKAKLQVIDEGIGIPDEYHSRIFNKYEVATLRQEGVTQTGIGLSVCKTVADAHGWEISVSNNQPRGSVFTVEM